MTAAPATDRRLCRACGCDPIKPGRRICYACIRARGSVPTADRGCPTCGVSYAMHAKCAGCQGMIGPAPHMLPISTAYPMYCVGCVQARIRRGEL